MRRYYFHLYNDLTVMDMEGRLLPDLEAARANGIREAREMMMDTVSEGRINFSHRIEIAGDAGATVATIMFQDAVRVEG
jgi:hypothetical protein